MGNPIDQTFAAGFDADLFRSKIRDTMLMGMPTATPQGAIFRRHEQRTYAVEDPDRNPYEWGETPTSETTFEDVQVPVAVEFSARPAGSAQTVMGEFDVSRAILTLLDVDYELVKDADEVLLGGNRYRIQFTAPPIGLFSVTVYQIYAQALDES